jgi:hypothetical protein
MEAKFRRVFKGVGVVQSTARIILGEGRENASIVFLKERKEEVSESASRYNLAPGN